MEKFLYLLLTEATSGLQLGCQVLVRVPVIYCPFCFGFSQMLLVDAGNGMNSDSSYFWHLLRWDTRGVAYLSLSGILL